MSDSLSSDSLEIKHVKGKEIDESYKENENDKKNTQFSSYSSSNENSKDSKQENYKTEINGIPSKIDSSSEALNKLIPTSMPTFFSDTNSVKQTILVEEEEEEEEYYEEIEVNEEKEKSEIPSITLFTSIFSTTHKGRQFMYRLDTSTENLLPLIIHNLELDPKPLYRLILRTNKEVHLMEPGETLASLKLDPEESVIQVIKVFQSIKILTDFDFYRTILVDVTKPIKDILESIASKLRFKCQSDQFCLWQPPQEEVGETEYRPLDSHKSIMEQSLNFSTLLFRRRIFIVFIDEFNTPDTLQQIYRDVKQNYLNGNIQCTTEEAIEAACLMVYADAESKYHASVPQFKDSLKPYLPVCLKSSSKLKKAFIQSVQESMLVHRFEKFEAMRMFIKYVRMIPGYGGECYPAIYIIEKHKSKNVDLWIEARGIRIVHGNKLIKRISIRDIAYVLWHKKKLRLRSLNEQEGSHEYMFKILKNSENAKTLLQGCMEIMKHRFRKLWTRRENLLNGEKLARGIQLVEGRYCTLRESKNACKAFTAEVEKLPPEDFEHYGLRIAYTEAEANKSDAKDFNELEEVKPYLLHNEDGHEFADLSQKLAKDLIKDLSYQITCSRLQLFDSDMHTFRNKVKNLTPDDAFYFITQLREFTKVIPPGFPYLNLEMGVWDQRMVMATLASRIESHCIKGNENFQEWVPYFEKTMDHLISEFSEIATLLAKKPFPDAKIHTRHPHRRAHQKFGGCILYALLSCIDEFINYLYKNKISLMCEIECDPHDAIMELSKLSTDLHKFAFNYLERKNDTTTIDMLSEYLDSFDKFLLDLNKSDTITKQVSEPICQQAKKIEELFFLLKKSLLHKGKHDRLGIIIYPGNLQSMDNIHCLIPDFTAQINPLLDPEDPKFVANPSIRVILKDSRDEINHYQSYLRELEEKLQENPFNETIKVKLVQSIHELKAIYEKIHKEVCPFLHQLKGYEGLQQILEFSIPKFEQGIFSLTTMCISYNRLSTIKASLQDLSEAMQGHINIPPDFHEKCISHIEYLDKYLPMLSESMLDSIPIHAIHKRLPIILQDMRKIKIIADNCSINAADQEFPLILDMMIPLIETSLTDPFIDDSYSKCLHVNAFCQLQMDVAKLIAVIRCLLDQPFTVPRKADVEDLTKRVHVLEKIYEQLALMRPRLMNSPWTFSVIKQIKALINIAIITEANLIDPFRKFDVIMCSNALKEILSISMGSIKAFFNSLREVRVSPFRKLATNEDLEAYAQILRDFTVSLNKVVGVKSQASIDLIRQQTEIVNQMIEMVTRSSHGTSHYFDFCVEDIDDEIDEIYERCKEAIPALKKSFGVSDKVIAIQNADTKIIEGEQSSPKLLKEFMDETTVWIENYMRAFGKQRVNNLYSEIKAFMETALQTDNWTESYITRIKQRLVSLADQLPDLTPEEERVPIEEQNEALLYLQSSLRIKDTINICRQLSPQLTIMLDFEPLEETQATEINELSEILSEQFHVMLDAFNDLLKSNVITRNLRLTLVTSSIQKFFQVNSEFIDNKKKENQLIDSLEDYTKRINAELQVILNRIRILHPIMDSPALFQSSVVIGDTVEKIIEFYHPKTEQEEKIDMGEEMKIITKEESDDDSIDDIQLRNVRASLSVYALPHVKNHNIEVPELRRRQNNRKALLRAAASTVHFTSLDELGAMDNKKGFSGSKFAPI